MYNLVFFLGALGALGALRVLTPFFKNFLGANEPFFGGTVPKFGGTPNFGSPSDYFFCCFASNAKKLDTRQLRNLRKIIRQGNCRLVGDRPRRNFSFGGKVLLRIEEIVAGRACSRAAGKLFQNYRNRMQKIRRSI